MKLSEWNKLMGPKTADATNHFSKMEPQQPENAGVTCDNCDTEMVVIPTYHNGSISVKCLNCGHTGTRF